MSQNYSNQGSDENENLDSAKVKYRWLMLFIIPVWVVFSFYLAQFIVIGLIWLLSIFNVSLKVINESVLNTLLDAFVYLITIFIVIIIPWIIRKYHTSRSDIGINRLPQWIDILLAPAGLIAYLIISTLLILVATRILPWFNINQVQNVGFQNLNQRFEYILAFTTLVVVVPIAEEMLFRGYLFGKLKKYVPIWVAIIVTSILFGAIHGAWNLAIDTFALSIILCLLREFTGNIWASILLHMMKNGIAFYILFIYPTLLTKLVG